MEILAIVGPTASGKTELALKTAAQENGELISVDSRQIYKHLSVGTAKPRGTWHVVRGKRTYHVPPITYHVPHTTNHAVDIPYHLVDMWEPDQPFSAAEFVSHANPSIADIQKRGKKPILVGGTGLYFKALTQGLADLPHADDKIRAKLKAQADDHGRDYLHKKLAKIDPEAAVKIPVNNIQRVIRALEVYEITGKPISYWHQKHRGPPPGTVGDDVMKGPSGMTALQFIGIDLGREKLVKRIEARCESMMKDGMIEETQALLAKGYAENCPALTGLGYPRVLAYLKGKLSFDDCLKLLIQDTRQYAKRQMTWFRHQLPVTWKE